MISHETIAAVEQEAERAMSSHGPLTQDLCRAYTILGEEFGEVGRALLEVGRAERSNSSVAESWKRAAADELVQLAATALLLVDNLRRSQGRNGGV